MTDVDVEATLLVDDGAGDTRELSVNDLKTTATGAATQVTLAAVLAKLTADPATQTTLAALLVQATAIAGSVDQLEGFTDGIETKLDTLHADVDGLEGAFTTLNAKDFATQTTLAALLAKVIAAPSTEAKQDAANTLLTAIDGHVDGVEGSLTTLNAKDFATQTTLAAILAKIIAAPATEAKQDTGNTSLASILSAAGATGDASSASTLVGLLKAIKAAITSTVLVDSGVAVRTPKNYYQGTVSNTAITLATLIGTTIPTGSKIVKAVFTQPVRFRDDGTNPTASIGYPIPAGVEQTFDQTDLTAVKLIRQSADATADVAFYA